MSFYYVSDRRQDFFDHLEDGHCSISDPLSENCNRPFVTGHCGGGMTLPAAVARGNKSVFFCLTDLRFFPSTQM